MSLSNNAKTKIEAINVFIDKAQKCKLTEVIAHDISPQLSDELFEHFTLIGFEAFYNERDRTLTLTW